MNVSSPTMHSRSPLTLRALSLLLVLTAALRLSSGASAALAAQAADLTVNTAADTDDGTCDASNCTLREALSVANVDGLANNITFDIPETDGDCSAANVCTIAVLSTLPAVSDTSAPTTIDGSGADITISGGNAVRPFVVNASAELTLRALSVLHGYHASDGGAILNDGILTIEDSSLSDNRIANPELDRNHGGGAIRNNAALTISNSTLNQNSGLFGCGGAIFNLGNATISSSSLTGNRSGDLAYGYYEGYGGAIYNVGSLTIDESSFRGNYAVDSGGAIYGGSLIIDNSTFIFNYSEVGAGGAIMSWDGITISNSTISNNVADTYGGIGGSGTVSNSTISGNKAYYEVGGIGGGWSIINSTISGNSAYHIGGAILHGNLINSTISGNTADFDGGAVYVGGSLTIINSIIANRTLGGDCVVGPSGTVNASFSLIEDGLTCVNGTNNANLTGDPALGPLQDNGGPTHTHLPAASSVVVNAGDNATCEATDQRGVPRPQGSTCDMGAVELQGALQEGPDFVVNSSADTNDGFCSPRLPDGSDCTLREALIFANADGLPNTIIFDIPRTDGDCGAANVCTIIALSTLPAVNDAAAPTTIDGSAAQITVSGDDAVRPFVVNASAALTLRALRVIGGLSATAGGAVLNDGLLTIEKSNLSANHTVDASEISKGGAIRNNAGATLIIISSALSDNSSPFGGAIYNGGSVTISDSTFTGNDATYANGGAIRNAGTATLIISNSTFAGNSALQGGAINNIGSAIISNSTLTGNFATSTEGGAIFNNGILELNNSTLSGNSATKGGGIFQYAGTTTLKNSIIAGSIKGGECDLLAGVINATNSLIEDGLGCVNGISTANLTGDPDLSVLQTNGGPTLTMMPAGSSVVVGAGNIATCEAADQRGVPRPQGSDCDMGAVEQTFQAALSGIVDLQGRDEPGTAGTVTLSDAAAIMPDTVVLFDAITGAFSFPSVPVASGGTDYDVTAVHSLYLANQLPAQATAAAANLDLGTTELRGGDANNDGTINILDLGCLGSDYNQSPGTCGGQGGTDINNDSETNIQDLAIAGGNYLLTTYQPWGTIP